MSEARSADSNETSANAERLAKGELPVKNTMKCEFCGAGPDAHTRTSATENVAQHGHTGTRHTRTECNDCGAVFVVTAVVQTRANLPSRPREQSIQWGIPEGYCKPYCTDCGCTGDGIEICEANRDVLAAIENGATNGCPRCGGDDALMVDWLKREPPEPSARTEVSGR